MSGSGPKAMWGGRFEGEASALFRAVNDSLPVDWRLVREDIAGSRAWVAALGRAGVLTDGEVSEIDRGLAGVLEEAEALEHPPLDSGAEDVHSWVEQRLISRIGVVGKKLHTGRSRNDQVATDLRLWLRGAVDDLCTSVRECQSALVGLGERNPGAVIPGYTHLQRAQPVLLGHWALGFVEMLERDLERLRDARRRVNVCPLGSGALAGTAFPVDREWLARELGFDGITRNSIDGVCARDFAAEVVGGAALCAVHLSRLAEDLIVYASGEFGFVELADAVSSGSSLMPQKKNPDGLELVRGKAAVLCGRQQSLLGLMKGLPTAYNKDLQEDKALVFGTVDDLSLCLKISALTVSGLVVNGGAARRAAMGGYSNATDLADHLVSRGVAFRDAHEQAGLLVRLAIEKGVALESLTLDEMRELAPGVGEDVHGQLEIESGMGRRDVVGGTAPARVASELSRWRGVIEAGVAS